MCPTFQVPVIWWEGAMWVRISCQLYNVLGDYEALGNAVLEVFRDPTESIFEESQVDPPSAPIHAS